MVNFSKRYMCAICHTETGCQMAHSHALGVSTRATCDLCGMTTWVLEVDPDHPKPPSHVSNVLFMMILLLAVLSLLTVLYIIAYKPLTLGLNVR